MVTFRPDQRANFKNHARRLSFGGTECTREIVNGGSHPRDFRPSPAASQYGYHERARDVGETSGALRRLT